MILEREGRKREGEGEREREKERMGEKETWIGLVVACMYPNWGPNLQPRHVP